MNKLCLCTLLGLTLVTTASAQVSEETENYQGNLLKYPIISGHKKSVDKDINKEIASALSQIKLQLASNKGAADKISMSYKLLGEDKDRLNLLLYSWTYNNGAAHGNYFTQGLSYDLRTGKKAEVEKYLGRPAPQVLDAGVRSGKFFLTGADNKPVKLDEFWKVEKVSRECILNKDGSLTLIYQPYDLAPYVVGNTFLTIPQSAFPEFTGKPLPKPKPEKVKPAKKQAAPPAKAKAEQPKATKHAPAPTAGQNPHTKIL